MGNKISCSNRTKYVNKDGESPCCGELCDNFIESKDKIVYCDYCKGYNDCLDEFAIK